MATERLQKILSNAGVASRRVAEEMVAAGRVAVNGVVQASPGARADLESDEVTVDGVPIVRGQYRYFMLNKPPGILSAARDDRGRETVLDLVPVAGPLLHPVGRLDLESEGLLILTNDGHLTDLLTHPVHEVTKEYLVGIDRPLAEQDLKRLVRGLDIEGEHLSVLSARIAQPPDLEFDQPEHAARAWLLLTLGEGKKREIRKLVAALGRRVLVLRRLRIGPLALGSLGTGAFRELTGEEVEALYSAAKPRPPSPDRR